MQIKKLAVAAGAVGALALSLVTAVPASADYAPSAGDAVGVGSDTVQNIGDFVADGDHLGDAGYNGGASVNKVVNYDATSDLNVRLAYGTVGNTSTNCTPGTGTVKGTGNQSATHADTLCQLNPTIVLRSGLRPVQRPNGSGSGANALRKDIDGGLKNIDYSRASSLQGSKFVAGTVAKITVASDPFAMLSATVTNMPAASLTITQLKNIYQANTTGLNGFGTTGCPTWGDVGVTGAAATQTIYAIYPQTGSGTYAFFSSATTGIGITTLGNCAHGAEENDPEAIDAAGAQAVNAIEPISGARLNLFLGKDGNGAPNAGTVSFPYFVDPSCVYGDATVGAAGTAGACGTGTATATNFPTPVAQAPNVTYYNTTTTGYNTTRPLYMYFRLAQVNNTIDAFQPGVAQNLIRTLFANPCSGTAFNGQNLNTNTAGCTTVASPTGTGTITYGPGGAPFYASAAGQALISASGAKPTYIYDATGA